jgi:cytochrome P450
MLDILLDAYDDKELSNLAKIDLKTISGTFRELVIAGIDTSSNAAAMTIYNLAK